MEVVKEGDKYENIVTHLAIGKKKDNNTRRRQWRTYYLLLFVNRMDDRTFPFCRMCLDDPDRAKDPMTSQALCSSSDLAITADAPSGAKGGKPCLTFGGDSRIKPHYAANCLRLPPLTIVFYARPDKTKDQRSCAPDLP